MPAPCRTLLVFLCLAWPMVARGAEGKGGAYWKVEDVRAGMKGVGRTVVKGTRIDTFQVEVLGVLRHVNPGRDLVLCKLSGMNLEHTGVIQGMSGSPVIIDGKLLGAVAFAWPFGKEPIAGVTPFVQMRDLAAVHLEGDPKAKVQALRFDLDAPLEVGGRRYRTAHVQQDFAPARADQEGLWLVPLKTPLAASGMSARSLAFLAETSDRHGLVPVQGGAVPAHLTPEEREARIEPGAALSVGMITGDFDLSGIGTVTHVEGKKVWGWGHPFMSLGKCEFPLMTGYVHTIMPRLTLSFKMGSPLRTVGTIDADVSTCIAGRLGPLPDMLPLSMALRRGQEEPVRKFEVRLARHRLMLSQLLQTALVNVMDMEGDPPEEMTARLKIKVHLQGQEPLVLDDVFSGPSFVGNRAAPALFSQVGMLMNQIQFNPVGPLRIERIETATTLSPGRRTADIEAVELDADQYEPGETVTALVTLRPYKQPRRRMTLNLKLPADLAEGNYTATVGDDLNRARNDLRDDPALQFPDTMKDVLRTLELVTGARRDHLALRVPTRDVGVHLDGKNLPDLPASMVQILSGTKRGGLVQPIKSALTVRAATPYVLQGSRTIAFRVVRNKAATRVEGN